MVYWQDLPMRRRSTLHPAVQLLRFTDVPAAPKPGGLASHVLPYFRAYCESSSIHCMHYLTDAKQQRWQKALWLFILAATSMAAVYVYFELAELFATQRIQTTILNTLHPIFYVPFPSVAVCLRNAIDWQRLQQAHPLFLPAAVARSPEAVQAFRSFFAALEDLRFDKLVQLAPFFANRSLAEAQLRLLNGVDLPDVMRHVTLGCADIFEADSCYWRRRPYDCCKLFTLETTEAGFCYVFNSAKTDKFYPYHNAKSGEASGLEAVIKWNASKLAPESPAQRGIHVMVKQPAQWHDSVRFFGANTLTKIAVTAQQTQTSVRTRVVGPEVRGCIFEDEHNDPLYKKIPGLTYWRGNCRTRCHQEYLVKRCNCSTSLLFPRTQRDNFSECRAADFNCIYAHEAIFSAERHEAEYNYVESFGGNSMVCNCLNSCNQLVYMSTVTSTPLEGDNEPRNESQMKLVRLDVYHHSTYMLKYSTQVRYTFVELLANFGGVIGLFLGASLLSAVELGYFVLIAVWAQLRWRCQRGSYAGSNGMRLRQRQRKAKVHARY